MTLALRDGREVLIRPIEPGDAALLVSGLEQLSEESRYRRFLAPKQSFTPSEPRYLTEVDHRDHEALTGDAARTRGVALEDHEKR